ncbi:uncharacterized protein LOC113215119 [Frankliniella occidentalis]|uniref:Uncharacterized protein LOC113215119 n=1 Tax=Frankliniella occidentalis TaxID=133901 RepID=A0A6J1TI25_FRAOC|nr:uncharacterized protein LOC113215119 [Frankliniella occidentalis]
MPQKKRGKSFTHTKSGRGKTERGGGGRGHRGRRTVTGYLPSEEENNAADNVDNAVPLCPPSPLCSPDAEDSMDSVHFRAALASPLSALSGSSECLASDQSEADSRGTPSPSPTVSRSFRELHLSQSSSTPSSSTSQAFVSPSADLVMKVLNLLRATLHQDWIPIADRGSYIILLMSRGMEKSTQRNINITFNGSLKITVHRRPIPESLCDEVLKVGGPAVVLSEYTFKEFTDRVLSIVNFVRSFEVCAGTCDKEYKHFWVDSEKGSVDKNPYGESRYDITYRSSSCHMLVPVRKWKCEECDRASLRFKRKVVHENISDYHQNTPNVYLSEEQKQSKLQDQQKKINAGKKKIARMQQKIKELLQDHGVNVDKDVSDCLEEAIKCDTNLTPEVKQLRDLFLQQQHKAASVKGKTGMRWHPAMIRFAILIKSHSSAAYDAIRQSGFICLPGERTLFDYTHTIPQMHGINTVKMQRLSEKVAKYEQNHQHFHNLLMDEIHISEKLVYSKSTGEMLGYVKLSEAEQEMENLMHVIQDKNPKKEDPQTAKRILAYMVKGVTNDVKEVVACYTTHSPTKEFLFDRTWDVITHCELAGIHILSVVCDGSAVNRGFIQMHTPTNPERQLKSGVVFACKNLCVPDRELFFFSDPPHLIKTLRNCFAKSGFHPKATRKLTKGGQFIVWKTIERLFLEDHEHTIRSSFKLNAQNVYLNSYSCMNVALATQVLSNTVSVDLASRNWANTSETVTFISKCNNFFDNLNGAHSAMGTRKANPRLDPYTSSCDKRFDELDEFVTYLRNWLEEVKSAKVTAKEKLKMFIPHQTFEGIEMTANALRGAVTFMLDVAKAKFINARVFCQDPLEQYFGKQRASIGGSSAPTEKQFYESDLKISIHRDGNVRKRSGNVEAVNSCMRISDEPLPKRPKVSYAYKKDKKSD